MERYITMQLELDESFRDMSEEEVKAKGWSFSPGFMAKYSDENKMTIALAHKKINILLAAIADKKSMVSRVKYEYRKAYPQILDYEDYQVEVAGKIRYGFRYRHEVDGVMQIGDVLLIIEKSNDYMITCTYQEADKKKCSKIMDAILKTIKF